MGGSIQNHAYSNFERYNFLSKARNTIRRIENSPVSEDAKTLYSGEAKALRGWMGLYLYDMFGPVPVSYTHLDVYKRQLLCTRDKSGKR